MKITKHIGIIAASAWGVALVFSACSQDKEHPGYEFMPNMYRSASYETYSTNPNTTDGKTAMLPAEGSVPRGFQPFEYGSSNEEYQRAGAELENPLKLTEEVLAEGKELYEMFCAHCHGGAGQGNGKIVENGNFPPPPSYLDGNSSRGGMMADLTEGKIYHTIMYGLNMMGPHASQINEEERWKIVYYVQTLQGKDLMGGQTEPASEEMEEGSEMDSANEVETPQESNETEVQQNEESN